MVFLSNEYKEITDYLGEGCPRADGYHFVLKVYVPEQFHKTADGTLTSIAIPDSVREETVYKNIVGLVLDIGPDCYKPEKFKNFTKRDIGDWVIFPPNCGTLFYYDGVPLRFVPEENILAKVNDPSKVSRD
jgi:co-chaperonin GroES (HSP10)